MHTNYAYFAPTSTTIIFPNDLKKKIFYWILQASCTLHENQHHYTFDLDHSDSYSFPVTDLELKYMFDTLGFLWLHHDSPSMLHFLEKLADGLSEERQIAFAFTYKATSGISTGQSS